MSENFQQPEGLMPHFPKPFFVKGRGAGESSSKADKSTWARIKTPPSDGTTNV